MVENSDKENFRTCIRCGVQIKEGKRRWICDKCKYEKNLARKKEFYKSQYNKAPVYNYEKYSEAKSDVEFNIMDEVYIFFYKNQWHWKHKKSKLWSAQGFDDYISCKRDAISAFL